jgi:hypothetical protein
VQNGKRAFRDIRKNVCHPLGKDRIAIALAVLEGSLRNFRSVENGEIRSSSEYRKDESRTVRSIDPHSFGAQSSLYFLAAAALAESTFLATAVGSRMMPLLQVSRWERPQSSMATLSTDAGIDEITITVRWA